MSVLVENTSKQSSGLHQAITDCRFHHVRMLVDFGLGIRKKTQGGQSVLVTALHIGQDCKRHKMFKLLLRHGAQCDVIDPGTGRDILSWACYLGRKEQVSQILEQTAGEVSLQRLDKYGYGALHYAVMFEHIDVVWLMCRIMSKFNISVDFWDKNGASPYIHAKRRGHLRIQNILINEGGASPGQFDPQVFKQREFNPIRDLVAKEETPGKQKVKNKSTIRQVKSHDGSFRKSILPPLLKYKNTSTLQQDRKAVIKLFGYVPNFVFQRPDSSSEVQSHDGYSVRGNCDSKSALPTLDTYRSLSSSFSNLSVLSEQPTSMASLTSVDTNISQAFPEVSRSSRRMPTVHQNALARQLSLLAMSNQLDADKQLQNVTHDMRHLLEMVAVQVKHGYQGGSPKINKNTTIRELTTVLMKLKSKGAKATHARIGSAKGQRPSSAMSKQSTVKVQPTGSLMSPLLENDRISTLT